MAIPAVRVQGVRAQWPHRRHYHPSHETRAPPASPGRRWWGQKARGGRASLCPVVMASGGGFDRGSPNMDLLQAIGVASLQQGWSGAGRLAGAVAEGAGKVGLSLAPRPEGFPPGPGGDSAFSLTQDPLAFLSATAGEWGDVVGLSLAGERVVLVSGPAQAKDVMVARNDLFSKEGTAFFPTSSLAGNGLLVSDGDLWRRQRQLSNPAFRQAAVETYTKAILLETKGMIDGQWQYGGVRDLYRDFNELTLGIVGTALFGDDMLGARSETICASIKTAFEFFARRSSQGFIVPEWVPTPDNVQYSAAVARLDEVVYGLIAERRARVGAGGGAPRDLLDRLLQAVDDDGVGMQDGPLRDELMTLMIAGQETSAIVLSWVCGLLATHPDVARRVREEVARVVGGGRAPEPKDAMALRYTEAVVLESMRLLPPAYMVGRCATEVLVLDGYKVPKGTTILIAPYLMHRDPRWWDAPGEFRPERWLEMEGLDAGAPPSSVALKGQGPNDAYIPFGGGPRNCIGSRFAMLEVVLVVASIVPRFGLRPVTSGADPIKPAALITLRPDNMQLYISPLKKNNNMSA